MLQVVLTCTSITNQFPIEWTTNKADFAMACEVLCGWFWAMTTWPLGCIAPLPHGPHEPHHWIATWAYGTANGPHIITNETLKRQRLRSWKGEDLYKDRSSVSVRRPPMRPQWPPRSSRPPVWELWNTSKDGGQPIWVSAPLDDKWNWNWKRDKMYQL